MGGDAGVETDPHADSAPGQEPLTDRPDRPPVFLRYPHLPRCRLKTIVFGQPGQEGLAFEIQDRASKEGLRVQDGYLEEYAAKFPGAVESHWIPMDRRLWKAENYAEFLVERRKLLAAAANAFLDSLLLGPPPELPATASILDRESPAIPGGVAGEDEERLLQEFNTWVIAHGLPPGEFMFELTDSETGEPLAVLDLAWPNGLQEGFSQAVSLLIDEGRETEEAANRAGYRYFTDVEAFRSYVEREILALTPVGN